MAISADEAPVEAVLKTIRHDVHGLSGGDGSREGESPSSYLMPSSTVY